MYRVGFSSENQTEAQNCMNMELLFEQIMADTKADSFKVFLSDKLESNYRFKIDPQYKANRKDAPKPRHYAALRMFALNELKAEITLGEEADDRLGIEQTKSGGGGTIICSIDKDLRQIPGLHYSITARTVDSVGTVEGLRHFYSQLLIGDRVDNITGVTGIGKVKSARLLDPLEHEEDFFERVRALYSDDERLLKNGQLLWIRRKENELWCFPTGVSLSQDHEELKTLKESTESSAFFSQSDENMNLSQERQKDQIKSEKSGPKNMECPSHAFQPTGNETDGQQGH